MRDSRSQKRRAAVAILMISLLALMGGASAADDLFDQAESDRTYNLGTYTDIFLIQEALDGGLLIGGHAFREGEADHAFLMKTDSSGEMLWYEIYPGQRVVALQELEDGSIILASLDEWINPESLVGLIAGSGYILRIDGEGSIIWKEELPGDAPAGILLSGEQILLFGWRWASADDPEAVTGFLYHYDLDGRQIDAVSYEEGSIHDSVALEDGGYLLVGNTGDPQMTTSVRHGHTIRVDEDGIPIWVKTYRNRSLFGITRMDGGYLIVGGTMPYGYAEGEAWALGILRDGTLLWEEKLQGYAAYCVAPYGDGFIIAGATGPHNPFITVITKDGRVSYSRRLLDSAGRFTAATALSDGRVAVGGWSLHTGEVEGWLVIFDPEAAQKKPDPAEAAGFGFIAVILGCAGAALITRSIRRD